MSATTMRALVIETPNGPFLATQRERPIARPGEVIVRVLASGVNPLDTKIRAGQAAHARHPLPAVLGMDLAGVVEALGDDVLDFKPGDEVYGMAGGVAGLQGSLAEFVAVDARLLAIKPSNLSMREAAALPLVAITAWEGLVDRAKTSAGQTVLVQGGAGGVGHIAVQLAVALGAEVFATVQDHQMDTIRRFGATPIDRNSTTIETCIAQHTGGRGFDVVYDTVGGSVLDASFAAVRAHGGHVVSCLGWGTHHLAPLSFRASSYSGVFTLLPMLSGEGREHHGEILREIRCLVESGELKPAMDPRRFTIDTAEEAHAAVAGAGASGKVVIELTDW